MEYEKRFNGILDEYAIKKTLEIECKTATKKAMEEGLEKGREEVKAVGVNNLLLSGRFTVTETANLMNVSETFARKVKKEIGGNN